MIRFFSGHPTAANLIMLSLILLGLLALPELTRETLPDFSRNEVQIRVLYPGASPEDVEQAVCQRLEDAVDSVSFVSEKRCEALEGMGSMVVEMEDAGQMLRFLSEIKSEVEAIDDFPDQVEAPIVKELGRTDPVVSLAITANTPLPHLKQYAEELKARLQLLPNVAVVEVQGFSDHQLYIELSEPMLRLYGLSVSDIADVVASQNVKLPSGQLENESQQLLVRYDDQRVTAETLSRLVVASSPQGAEIYLGDVAQIEDRFELDEARIEFDGERAALLQISKNKSVDALRVLEGVKAFLDEEALRKPEGVTLTLTRDTTSIMQDRLDMLLGNAWQGLILVLATMWLFFSWRYAFWVAMGIPVSFMATLFVMSLFGITINMITMVALLMAIGILMDDAIVISESIASRVAKGGTILEGAVEGVHLVGLGILSSFLTTICVFIGLAFLQGSIGQILKMIPITLIITLSVSLIEAFLVLPNHLVHSLEKANRKERAPWPIKQAFNRGFERFRQVVLIRWVEHVIRLRYLFAGTVLALFLLSLALPAGGLLKFTPFPDIDGDQLEARILLPQGTPLHRTEQVVERVVAALKELDARYTPDQPEGQPLVQHILVEYNKNRDSFEKGPHVATIAIDLLTSEVRTVTLNEVVGAWRDSVGQIPGVLAITYKKPAVGPAGRAIEIRLQHNDMAALGAASRDLQQWLKRFVGVFDVMDDLRPGKEEVRLKLRDGASSYGVNAMEVAKQIRAAFQGTTADEVQVGAETIELEVRLAWQNRQDLDALGNFPIMLPSGTQIPLSTVATLEYGRGVARINRIDNQRTVTVYGDVDMRYANTAELLAVIGAEFVPQLEQRYPGLVVDFSGEKEESRKTSGSMATGFLMGLIGVFVILSFQFRSYLEPMVVMLAIPLALIGVFWGHWLFGNPLTMPSMVGFISLAGIVVNNSILLVHFIKMHVAEGFDLHRSAVLAAKERFRAIIITTATTLAGLLPLMFEQSQQAQTLIPLVLSLVFGMAASTLLIIFVIPAFYCIKEDFVTVRERQES